MSITTGGTIDISLFAAGTDAGLRDCTTMALAEIFRWDVDFVLDLRDGDSFKLVYEQLRARRRGSSATATSWPPSSSMTASAIARCAT